MKIVDDFIRKNLPSNKMKIEATQAKDTLDIKTVMFLLSLSYLALTFFLFLSNASINIMLLYAIFTYVLYVPMVGIFSKPEKFKEFIELGGYKEHEYLRYVSIFMLVIAIILVFTNIIHPKNLLMIAQSFIDGIPDFKIAEFLTGFFKGQPWYFYILFVVSIPVAWPVYLGLLALILVFWILSFLFNFILNLVVFLLFIALVLYFFYHIWKVAYRGYKNSFEYIEGDFRLALYILSTVTMGIYVFILIFANLIIMR